MNMDNKRDMELSQYIFPIYSGGTIVGQGFVADGYFVTAAHVVKDFTGCFAVFNGNDSNCRDRSNRAKHLNVDVREFFDERSGTAEQLVLTKYIIIKNN